MAELRRIAPADAAARLAGLAQLDPRGILAESDLAGMCEAGECFEVATETGTAVLVTHQANGMLWVEAAQGQGIDMATAMDDALQATGARSIAFQTGRPGLVRRALRRGYHVAGFILKRNT